MLRVTSFARVDRRLLLNAILAGLTPVFIRPAAKAFSHGAIAMGGGYNSEIALPEPELEGHLTLEMSLRKRRSLRAFDGEAIPSSEIGQLLWAAQGVTDPAGLRTAPSAGALYPLELYVITSGSDGLPAGIYHYRSRRHSLETVETGDFRESFAAAALMQDWTARSAVIVVIAAAYTRTMRKYGERGRRYVAIEAGHSAQNIYLQAVALGRGATEVGAFNDNAIARLLRLPSDEEPVTSVAVGRPGTVSSP